MKISMPIAACALFFLYVTTLMADVPDLVAKGKIDSNGVPIPFINTVPTVADWNGDGVMDIITGEFFGGVSLFQAIGPLSPGQNWISEASGGKIDLKLNAGISNSGRNYLVVAGISGTSPGLPLPGGLATLPVNWDLFSDLEMALLNTTAFSNFLGTLDAVGEISARLFLPPLPAGSTGTIIHLAYCCNNPFDYVSNAAGIEVID